MSHQQQQHQQQGNNIGKSARSKITNITGSQVQTLLWKLNAIWDHLLSISPSQSSQSSSPNKLLLLPLRFHEIITRISDDEAAADADTTSDVVDDDGNCDCGDDIISGDRDGEGGGKHVLQEISILGHLHRIGATRRNANHHEVITAIELGAGTGRLSDRLSKKILCDDDPTTKNIIIRHVLIDRQNFTSSQTRDRHIRARILKRQQQQQQRRKAVVSKYS